jgi:glycerate kinase
LLSWTIRHYRNCEGQQAIAMNVLIAPSCFKESLSAQEVADCIEEGIRRVLPDANIQKTPLIDGGEGFTKTLVQITGGALHMTRVTGPVGQPVEAYYGILGGVGQKTAVMEMASAAGLRLVPEALRNPLSTTTYGVGELIKAALEAGAERILIGCADSGTNDGGAGMAQALGIALTDAEGNSIGWGGGELSRLRKIDISGMDPRLERVTIDVACNFNSILCGANAVSRVFGPQKGASPTAVEILVDAMEHYAAVIREQLGVDVRLMPGGGAAGGLGAGLRAFLNASLHHRYEVVMQYIDLDTPLSKADLVITGEGCIDFSTSRGKIPCEVGRRAKTFGLPVMAVVGMVGPGAEFSLKNGVDSFASIMESPMQLSTALCRASDLLKKGAENVMRTILIGQQLGDRAQRDLDHLEGRAMTKPIDSREPSNGMPMFVNQLCQDLRTPLSLAIAYSGMIRDGLLGEVNPSQAKALQQIIKHSYWVLSIITGLLQSASRDGSKFAANAADGNDTVAIDK